LTVFEAFPTPRRSTKVSEDQPNRDYYQWGRAKDGHQTSASLGTQTPSSDIVSGNSKFIYGRGDGSTLTVFEAFPTPRRSTKVSEDQPNTTPRLLLKWMTVLLMEITTNGGEQKMDINHLHHWAHKLQNNLK
jgi:hypothetical protein